MTNKCFRGVAIGLCSALMSCLDVNGPAPLPEEFPRGDYHLLIERFLPSGERSWYTMTTSGAFVAPFDAPADARRLVPSPDGRSIAYLREKGDDVELWVMDRDGSNRLPIVEGTIVIDHVSWSPDGTRLAFSGSTFDDTEDIWIVNRNGSGLINLTPDAGSAVIFDRNPEWSPDGTRLVFSSTRSGPMRIWTMNANGTGAASVFAPTVQQSERTPVWSPGGTHIAFTALSAAGQGIGIARADGSELTMTVTPGDAGRLAWLPDGRLMYTAILVGDYELFARTIASPEATNLSRHADHDVRVSVLRQVTPLTAWKGFFDATTYPGGGANPIGVAVADLNADQRPDVVVANPGNSAVEYLHGIGGGALHRVGTLNAPAAQQQILAHDVTNDSIADVVVLSDSGFYVWRGSAGGPGLSAHHPLDGAARGLSLRTRTGNGVPEIATTVTGPGGFMHFKYHSLNGNGDIVPLLDATYSYVDVRRMCVGDVNGDGPHDFVALTGQSANSVLLIRGRPDPSIDEPVAAAQSVTVDGASATCADLDGDRRADLILARAGVAGGITVLMSGGSQFTTTNIGLTGNDVAVGDVDRDGDLDLIIARSAASGVQFVRNRGHGVFAAPVDIPTPAETKQIVLADVDGDLYLDLVATSANGTLFVLRNRGR
jgi:hypothetical protein